MKFINSGLALGLIFAVTATTANLAEAAVKKSNSSKASKAAPSKKSSSKVSSKSAKKATDENLQTDVKFDDSVLHGQYQTPDEALTKVENEKGFGDLIGVRKHFKDRLSVASEQE